MCGGDDALCSVFTCNGLQGRELVEVAKWVSRVFCEVALANRHTCLVACSGHFLVRRVVSEEGDCVAGFK